MGIACMRSHVSVDESVLGRNEKSIALLSTFFTRSEIHEIFLTFMEMSNGKDYLMHDEFLAHCKLEKNNVSMKIFNFLCEDPTTKRICFLEYSLMLWNFLTLDPNDVPIFVFLLFDTNKSKRLLYDKIIEMIQFIHPSAYETTKALQVVINKLTAQKVNYDVNQFSEWLRGCPSVISPIVALQYQLRGEILKQSFWQKIGSRRIEIQECRSLGFLYKTIADVQNILREQQTAAPTKKQISKCDTIHASGNDPSGNDPSGSVQKPKLQMKTIDTVVKASSSMQDISFDNQNDIEEGEATVKNSKSNISNKSVDVSTHTNTTSTSSISTGILASARKLFSKKSTIYLEGIFQDEDNEEVGGIGVKYRGGLDQDAAAAASGSGKHIHNHSSSVAIQDQGKEMEHMEVVKTTKRPKSALGERKEGVGVNLGATATASGNGSHKRMDSSSNSSNSIPRTESTGAESSKYQHGQQRHLKESNSFSEESKNDAGKGSAVAVGEGGGGRSTKSKRPQSAKKIPEERNIYERPQSSSRRKTDSEMKANEEENDASGGASAKRGKESRSKSGKGKEKVKD